MRRLLTVLACLAAILACRATSGNQPNPVHYSVSDIVIDPDLLLSKCDFKHYQLPFIIQYKASYRNNPVTFKMAIHHPQHDIYISNSLYKDNGRHEFEREFKAVWEDLLAAAQKKLGLQQLRFLDVGANIGLYSVWMAARGMEVHSFEPMITNFAVLDCSMRINPPLYRMMYINNLGLSDKPQDGMCMQVVHNNQGMAEVTNAHKCENSVNLTSLDMYWISTLKKQPVHIAKIDAEGFEEKVFSGGKEMFEASAPLYMMVEFKPDVLRRNGVDLDAYYKQLTGWGYSMWLIREAQKVDLDKWREWCSITNLEFDTVLMHENAPELKLVPFDGWGKK